MMRRIAIQGPPKSSRSEKDTFFRFLILANLFEYLEAGAVPALLLQLAKSFHMSAGQQGLLGGVVYLSLSLGGPFAGYLLRHYDHRTVVGTAVAINNFFTLLWALTPIDLPYSTHMFIAVRFLMGLTQCVVCVFLPLWTNQFAPKEKRTTWMGYLQVVRSMM
jgi:MFS family permease